MTPDARRWTFGLELLGFGWGEAIRAVERPRSVTAEERRLAQVWDEHWWGPTRTLDVHVASLRRKLGGLEAITTLRGVGYRFDPPT